MTHSPYESFYVTLYANEIFQTSLMKVKYIGHLMIQQLLFAKIDLTNQSDLNHRDVQTPSTIKYIYFTERKI